jgi:hypothetical protein
LLRRSIAGIQIASRDFIDMGIAGHMHIRCPAAAGLGSRYLWRTKIAKPTQRH